MKLVNQGSDIDMKQASRTTKLSSDINTKSRDYRMGSGNEKSGRDYSASSNDGFRMSDD